MKLIGIGDNVIDFYKDLNTGFPGGNALNVSVFINRHNDETSSYMGLISDEIEGKHVLKSLKEEKIDVSRVRRAYESNGKATVMLNEHNDRVFMKSNKEESIQSALKLNFNSEDVE